MKGGFLKRKLTEELIEVMCGLKAKGMHNKEIRMAVGIHEITLYRWLNKPSSKLHRALGEEFKKSGSSVQAGAAGVHPRDGPVQDSLLDCRRLVA